MTIKNIIWDWNGTLFDDVELCIDSMNHLLRENDLPLLEGQERHRRLFCFPVQEYYRRLGFDFERTSFPSLATRYMSRYQPESRACGLYSDAERTIRSLNKGRYHQAVLSASRQENLLEQLERFDIDRYFHSCLGIADELARSKVDIGRCYMEDAALEPEETVVIGDTMHDYELAMALGCRSVLINNGHEELEGKTLPEALVLDSIDQVVSLLEELNRDSI